MDTSIIPTDLTPKQEKFCQIVAAGSSLTNAYVQAYDSTTGDRSSAQDAASALSRRPPVKARIAALRDAIAEQFVISAAALRLRQHDIATAEPLVHVKRYNCRRCNGQDGRYQYIDWLEYADAVDEAAANKKPVPPSAGGIGYDPFAPPNPRCRSCRGTGEAFIYTPVDTTQLEGAAAAAYAGASIDARTGTIEIHQHCQQSAAQELHRMVPGAMAATRSLSANLTVNVPMPDNMTPEAALAFLETLKPS